LPFIGHYAASKHALEGLGDVMRREARPFGVDVILVEPGGIRTPMVVGQRASLAGDRAALSPADAALYGSMYDNFGKLVGGSWDKMIEPSVVAEAIVGALQSATPQARYQVGDDSKFLCDVARKTDPEIDAVVQGFWGG
jgi:NAD(P)-dependent dehydrogenase (short-subunit alcohol dehydrogenase family)